MKQSFVFEDREVTKSILQISMKSSLLLLREDEDQVILKNIIVYNLNSFGKRPRELY